MSLVAVVERNEDDSTQIPKTLVVPVGLPPEVNFESYFPRLPLVAGLAFRRSECFDDAEMTMPQACAKAKRLALTYFSSVRAGFTGLLMKTYEIHPEFRYKDMAWRHQDFPGFWA
jgi:hypothetical protein